MGKLKVHIFDPAIYPRLIYIVKGKDLKNDIHESFLTPDGETLNMEGADMCKAGVWDVQLKETSRLGVLIWLRELIDVSVVAHESVHAANSIFHSCGVDYDTKHDEHFAHMVGFIADCTWQTYIGKFKEE